MTAAQPARPLHAVLVEMGRIQSSTLDYLIGAIPHDACVSLNERWTCVLQDLAELQNQAASAQPVAPNWVAAAFMDLATYVADAVAIDELDIRMQQEMVSPDMRADRRRELRERITANLNSLRRQVDLIDRQDRATAVMPASPTPTQIAQDILDMGDSRAQLAALANAGPEVIAAAAALLCGPDDIEPLCVAGVPGTDFERCHALAEAWHGSSLHQDFAVTISKMSPVVRLVDAWIRAGHDAGRTSLGRRS